MIKKYFLFSILMLTACGANASDATELLTETAPVIVQAAGGAIKDGVVILAENAQPIINQADLDSIGENLQQIGNNLYQIGENTLRVLGRSTVKITAGAAKGTKFMADHPIFGVCCIAATAYTWYKWRQTNNDFRTANNRDMTLVDMWRTTVEHWRRA